jgi:opacity protein-like surface antigen
MRKKIAFLCILALTGSVFAVNASAQGGFYLGIQGGWSAQKPSLKDIDFSTNTTFLYGVRGGIKFMMIALEANYFQAAHNLEVSELLTFDWADREIDYNYLGVNIKYFFPLFLVQPFITAGYGYYTADIKGIGDDKNAGFNIGVGMELHLGDKFSLLAEGKYHRVKVDIDERELTLGDFTLCGGLNIYF